MRNEYYSEEMKIIKFLERESNPQSSSLESGAIPFIMTLYEEKERLYLLNNIKVN